MENSQAITYLGNTNFRNQFTKFGIKAVDRAKHMYVIGKSGTGKSTFIENLAIQDIQNGNGIAFLDPHGGSAEKLLEYIPEWRRQDVIYFAPFDTEHPISFNVMEDPGDDDKRTKVADGLLSAFKKIWVDAWSARMEYVLLNTIAALLEFPGSTLLSINRMLTDKDFRKIVVANIKNHSVRAFWIDEYGKWDQKYANEAGAAIQNKIGQFVANPVIRNMIGQPKSSFDLREAMDGRKIFIANLSKGRMGDQNSGLIGAMLITKIYLAAMSRAELSPQIMARTPSFFFYADEFQNFANDSFANILSEARKYKLCLTLVHQYVAQLPETLRDAIVGNVGSMVIFRIGPDDAELFEKQFSPTFVAEDFVNLGFRQMYISISIDGTASKPFSAMSLEMIPNTTGGVSVREEVWKYSREKYTHNREAVEAAISSWYTSKAVDPNAPVRPPQQMQNGGAPNQYPPQNTAPNNYQQPPRQNPPQNKPFAQTIPPMASKPLPPRTSQPPVQQRTLPPIPKIIPPVPQEQKAPEPKLSEQLSEMIQAFDRPVTKQPTPKREFTAPKPVEKKTFVSLQSNTPKFITKEVSETKKTILSTTDKSANGETKSNLKDTIARILSEKKDSPKVIPAPEFVSIPKAEKHEEPVVEKKEEVKQETSQPKTESITIKSSTKREVPEDVLRRILA